MPARPYDPNDPDSARPGNFTFGRSFYGDGTVALIFGNYRGNPERCLGMRWMRDEGPLGFPAARGNPMWMVVPRDLALYMLEGIATSEIDMENPHIRHRVEFNDALAALSGRA